MNFEDWFEQWFERTWKGSIFGDENKFEFKKATKAAWNAALLLGDE